MNNEIDVAQAKTVAKLADSLLKSVAIDLEYKRLVEDLGTKNGPQAVADLNLNIVMAPVKQEQLIGKGAKQSRPLN